MARALLSSKADIELGEIQAKLKLQKMLFLSDALASAGNALKVFILHGNPLWVNISQWAKLLMDSVKMVKAAGRDKKIEMMIRNRERIDKEWYDLQG